MTVKKYKCEECGKEITGASFIFRKRVLCFECWDKVSPHDD